MKRIVFLIIILIVAIACKEVFEVPPEAFLKAELLDSTTEESDTSTVTISGIGIDNTLYKDSALTEILFPLSAEDTSKFLVSFDSVEDTITFIYETTLVYASMETGFYNEYTLHSITFSTNRIDSIAISDTLVTKAWNENITIYLRPLSSGSN
jgi:hypothetical protein